MKKGVVVFLVGFFLFFSLYFVGADATNVTECGVLNQSGDYILTANLTSTGDCLNINASDIILDCDNNWISFGNESGGFGIFVFDGVNGYNNVTIKNCDVEQNETGVNDSAIFFGSNSDGAVVYNTFVSTYGEGTAGIVLEENSTNANISLNYIDASAIDAPGILLGPSGINATIINNFIGSSGDDASGIIIEGAHDSLIYNNTIASLSNRTLDNAVAGILIDDNSYNLNVSWNIITVLSGLFEDDGYYVAGIWIWGDNSTIDNNAITTGGELGYGVFLNSVEGINITSNLIITYGEFADSIHSEMSDVSLLFYNNTIFVEGDNSSGIYLDQDSNDNISSNMIIAFGNYSNVIFFNQSHNATLSRNLMAANVSTSYVLYLITSAGELIYDNWVVSSTTDSGVHIETSDASDFNTTKTSGINVIDESYIGGNYWANIDGTGYSESCAETDGDYICDSAYDLETGDAVDYLPLSMNTTYTVPVSHGGSSGGGGYPIFRPTEEQLGEGYTSVLYTNWKVLFNVNNELHSFKVELVNSLNVKIVMSSEAQEVVFLVGEEKKFELSRDNYYDVLVRLNSISSGKVNFTIQTINEKIPSSVSKDIVSNVVDNSNKIETSDNSDNKNEQQINDENYFDNWLLVKTVIIILLVVILVIIYFRHRRKQKRVELFLKKAKIHQKFRR